MHHTMALLVDWILHLDTHLAIVLATYGAWAYALLFCVIFVETGVVLMPFLPGDSLLFVAGALVAKGLFSLWPLFGVLLAAAVLGDALNFAIGTLVRRRGLDAGRMRLIRREHLIRTGRFFDQHGGKTIILARFVPIVRTFAPFVAALGSMPLRRFFTYNVGGAVLWIGLLLAAGYCFGNIPWVSAHLTAVIMGIVVLSLLPALVSWLCAPRSPTTP